MDKIRLGKTDMKVTRVGMGGIPLTRPTEENAIKLIQHALNLGVNFIDTAIGYGISEERIGKAIADRREKVFIATKGGGRDKARVMACIDQSLKNLNVECIDLWQFHGINTTEYLEIIIGQGGVIEAAQEALEAGKIKHIGFSSHSLDVAIKAVPTGHFETVQVPFNFICNEAADELLSLTKEHDVGFIAMKPFAGGMLDNAKLVIKFLMQYDNVLPIPGIEKIEEIDEIVNIIEKGSLKPTKQEREEMEAIKLKTGTRFCRRCGYCLPCPEGVKINSMMTIKALYGLWSPERFFSWDYVKENVESVTSCIQCGECEKKCPYNLPIREMLIENLEFYEQKKREFDDKTESK